MVKNPNERFAAHSSRPGRPSMIHATGSTNASATPGTAMVAVTRGPSSVKAKARPQSTMPTPTRASTPRGTWMLASGTSTRRTAMATIAAPIAATARPSTTPTAALRFSASIAMLESAFLPAAILAP